MGKTDPEKLQERILALIDSHVKELEKMTKRQEFAASLSYDLTRYLKGITDFVDQDAEKLALYQKTASKLTKPQMIQELEAALHELKNEQE